MQAVCRVRLNLLLNVIMLACFILVSDPQVISDVPEGSLTKAQPCVQHMHTFGLGYL